MNLVGRAGTSLPIGVISNVRIGSRHLELIPLVLGLPASKAMKRFHLIFGVTVIVVFVLTGQYMDKFLNHLVGMSGGPRMLYRTRHIYILLAGLANQAIETYFTYGVTRWRKALQFLGSGLIVAATALFVVEFFSEPKLAGLETPWSGQGIYLIAYGTLLHLISTLGIKKRADPAD